MTFITGLCAAIFYLINTIFWVIPIVIFALLKLIPIAPWQRLISYVIDGCADCWVKVNGLNLALFSRTSIEVSNMPTLSEKQWYMVVSNHQSWVDIVVLQQIFNGKIPFLKFFLKQQLLYVPIIGLAWWALDFPFMKRYSRAFIENNPQLKGKDIETTRKKCQKFKLKPVSVMSFVEGTRFTAAKNQLQQSEYQDLLKPRAGGLAFSLNAMAGTIESLVDVTIYYADGIPSFWQFVSGQVKRINVDVKLSSIGPELIGDYENDALYKATFQQWLNKCWSDKQALLNKMKEQAD
ncbi:MAG: acyltransferase [Psychrobium sp.]|nr:acyltransferase [Psychrobium sp.]